MKWNSAKSLIVLYLWTKALFAEEGSPEQIFNNPTQDRTREFLKRVLK